MEWLARYDARRRPTGLHPDRRGRHGHRPHLPAMGRPPARARRPSTPPRSPPSSTPPTPRARPAVELIVTLFTGHMSGVNWIPAWATGGDEGDERFRVVSGGAVQPRRRVLRNWYADAAISDAQALLADRVAVRAQRTSRRVGVGPRERELELHDPARPERGGAMARADDLGASNPRPSGADHDRHAHGGPRERAPHRPGRSRSLVRLRLHARLPRLRRLVDRPHRPAPRAVPRRDHQLARRRTRRCCSPSSASPPPRPASLRPASRSAKATPPATPPRRSTRSATADRSARCSGATPTTPRDLHRQPPLDLAVHERTFGLWRADGTAKPAVDEISRRRGRPCRNPHRKRPWLDITVDEFGV